MPKVSVPGDRLVVKVSHGGSMNGDLMKTWAMQCLLPRMETHTPGCLILDGATPHNNSEFVQYIKNECNLKVVYVPAKMTHILQPLDVGVFGPFKSSLKRQWEQWLAEGSREYTRYGNRRRQTYQEICNAVLRAMEDITSEHIRRSFQVRSDCGTTI